MLEVKPLSSFVSPTLLFPVYTISTWWHVVQRRPFLETIQMGMHTSNRNHASQHLTVHPIRQFHIGKRFPLHFLTCQLNLPLITEYGSRRQLEEREETLNGKWDEEKKKAPIKRAGLLLGASPTMPGANGGPVLHYFNLHHRPYFVALFFPSSFVRFFFGTDQYMHTPSCYRGGPANASPVSPSYIHAEVSPDAGACNGTFFLLLVLPL